MSKKFKIIFFKQKSSVLVVVAKRNFCSQFTSFRAPLFALPRFFQSLSGMTQGVRHHPSSWPMAAAAVATAGA